MKSLVRAARGHADRIGAGSAQSRPEAGGQGYLHASMTMGFGRMRGRIAGSRRRPGGAVAPDAVTEPRSVGCQPQGVPSVTMKPTLWRKLYRIYIVVGLLLLLFMGAISYRELRREKLSSIESNLDSQLAQLDLAVDGYFSNIESGVRALADNPLVSTREDGDFTNFTQARENAFTYRVGPTEQRIIDLFAQYRAYFRHVSSVYMGRENGGFVRSHRRARPTRYDPRQREWYILARNNPGRVMRTEPYRSVTTEDINIGTATALLDENGKAYGVRGHGCHAQGIGRVRGRHARGVQRSRGVGGQQRRRAGQRFADFAGQEHTGRVSR